MNSNRSRGAAVASFVVAAALAVVVFGWIGMQAAVIPGFSDSVDYLMLADFYGGWFRGETAGVAVDYYRISRFPPGFPLLVALVGGGTQAVVPAIWLTAAASIFAVIATWAWQWRERQPVLVAMLVAISIVAYPEFFLWAIYPTSEPVMLALTVLAFALAAGDPPTRSRLMTVALVVSLVPLVRMIAVALVLAFIVWAWRQPLRSRGERALASVIAMLPAAAWMLHRSLMPGVDSYATQLATDSAAASDGGFIAQLIGQPWRIVGSVGANWTGIDATAEVGAAFRIVAIVFLVLAAIGWWRRARANTLDAGFLFFYLGVVVAWPFPAEIGRFLAAVVPVLVVSAASGVTACIAFVRARRSSSTPDALGYEGALIAPLAAVIVVVGSIALSTPILLKIAQRASMPIDADLAGMRLTRSYFTTPDAAWAEKMPEVTARIIGTMVQAGVTVPPGECIYGTSAGMLFIHAQRSTLPYPYGMKPGEVDAALRQCNWFFVMFTTSPQYGQPYLYPLREIDPFVRPVLANYFEFRGSEHLAAALLVRRDKAEAALPKSATQNPSGDESR